ncbi:MAG: ATP-dependent helicase [Clostridia bacterium]|nr:ATP-dependent helicase [Clostridia bacterium]
MSLLKTLNKSQKEAVKHSDGPVLVLAGAGCGKTCVLTNRIAYLVKDGGISPENILTITLSNKEANKVRESLLDLGIKKANDVNIMTMGQLGVSILRENIEEIGFSSNFTLYDYEDKKKTVKECMAALNINEQKIAPKTIIDYISDMKNNYILVDDAKDMAQDNNAKKIAKCYALYEDTLFKNNAIDMDDIVFKTVMLFDVCPKVLKKYQKQFEHVLVDEYQDVTTISHKLLQMLTDKSKNLFAVGNDDEGIFKCNGADASYIANFKKEFKKADIITLDENFRSTKTLVDISNAVISNNQDRIAKEITTKNDDGKKATLYYAYDENDEATYITNIISTKNITEDKPYSDFAILYRSNMQARVLEEHLAKENIPFKIYGGMKFYERKEVKDIVSYLKVLLNDKDELSIRRVINIPKRNIGNTTLDKIDECAKKHKLYLYQALRDCSKYNEISKLTYKIERFTLIVEELKEMMNTNSISDIVRTLVERTNYIKMLEDEETQDARNRIENIYELIKRAEAFEESAEEPTLEKFLENISLVDDTEYNDSNEVVKLMSINVTKGEEFDTVFLMGFEDGIFPSYLSIFEDKENEMEEERRLLYVALTRAMNNLHITHTKSRIKNGQANHNKISRFNEELPQDLMELKKKERKKIDEKITLYDEKITPMLQSGIKFSVEKNTALLNAEEKATMNFKVGEKFNHTRFGEGKIKEIENKGELGYALKIKLTSGETKSLMWNDKTANCFVKF